MRVHAWDQKNGLILKLYYVDLSIISNDASYIEKRCQISIKYYTVTDANLILLSELLSMHEYNDRSSSYSSQSRVLAICVSAKATDTTASEGQCYN